MAAGQGFKTFTTGEVLTAGDVNGYLMQGINVFTNATARDAAITAPAEGQFAFTKDNNSLWYYDGAGWVASGATGDIEGVTAGVGISGGGTSGTVTITNSMATAIDAKGDLVPGTGADTFARLAVGANNTVLTADSTTATGLKWAAAASGTKIGQVAQTFLATTFSTSSSTFTDLTGLSVSITPTATTSKILVLVSITQSTSTGTAGNTFFQLVRDTTAIGNSTGLTQNSFSAVAGAMLPTSGSGQTGTIYLDSPSTTSATTYKIQMRNDGGYTAYINRRGADTNSGGVSTITVMEVVA